MATLYWQRDIGDSIADAKNTFSSWDSCMSKTYCKWPAIIAIIVGSLIALSLLWCLSRCLCCGAECCCSCLSCCRSTRRNATQGYQQAPPTPNPYYNQYQPPRQGPTYASGGMGFRGVNTPQTATFDAPSKNGGTYNEDALPPMPSWENATSRRVEMHDDVELEKLDNERVQSPNPARGGHAAPDNLLRQQETGRYYNSDQPESPHRDNVGGMSATPHHDYQQHGQVSLPSPYTPVYQNATSPSPYGGANISYFGGAGHSDAQYRGYVPSAPPSYHTRAPSVASPASSQAQSYPGQPQYQAYNSAGRKPVPGSWREV